jgi:hypothetical protein
MANANISHVTLSNTFSAWREATNFLANSANDLRNGNYYKDSGPVLNIKNGALYIDRQTGTTLNVVANANVENNFTTKTKIVTDEAYYHGDDARFANSKVIFDVANTVQTKNLVSNTLIVAQNTITTNLTVGTDTSGICFIQGDAYPSKTPLFVEGTFRSLDRGLNFYGNSIASVIVTANTSNTKIVNLEIDIPLLDGDQGQKGQKGQKGQPGVQGAQGAQGSAGLNGRQGFQGVQGLAGLKGEAGESIGGTKGDKGDKGEFGYGQLGDDGEKGQKGESIGAAKGEKGAKGDKGDLGDAGVNAPAPTKGDTGDLGDTGVLGDAGLSAEFVRAYANFSGGFVGVIPATINSSNNTSSITLRSFNYTGTDGFTISVIVYTLNFANPLSDANFSVIGCARKPNTTEAHYSYNGSGHMQLIDKTANYAEIAFGLSGNYKPNSSTGPTRYFVSQDGSIIVVGAL